MKDTIFLLIMVILSASSRTSSGTNIKGNDDVLNQFMTRLDKLTEQVEHLSKKGNVEERLENLEEIARVKLLRSCHELEQHGVSKNGKLASWHKTENLAWTRLYILKIMIIGKYLIDPDGLGIGDPPIEVRCIFGEGDGAITEIDHQDGKIIAADHCSGKQCFSKNITYSVSKIQMLALTSISTTCTQALSYGCYLAPLSLHEENLGGWLDVNGNYIYTTLLQISVHHLKKSSQFSGNEQNFFHGNHPGEHRCQCYDTKSCLNNLVIKNKCNCDALLPTWTQDNGIISAKDLLPISSVKYGPLTFDLKRANFTLGPLRCSGQLH